MKIVVISGGFDPLHSGHISYINAAKALGDFLVVGVNSDAWLKRKKGKPFLSFDERATILSALSNVDMVIGFDDSDGSALDLIHSVKRMFPEHDIIFANGGDRTASNIPEMSEKGIIFKFGVGGGDKLNSSSEILREWKSTTVERDWGKYEIIYEMQGHVVKILTLNPGAKMSNQMHFKRDEFWHVLHGKVSIATEDGRGRWLHSSKCDLSPGDSIHLPAMVWHQCANESLDQPALILEIQAGDCDEADIQRK